MDGYCKLAKYKPSLGQKPYSHVSEVCASANKAHWEAEHVNSGIL